ncbi:MAG: Rne/Rng family ribonuclease [Firmicutes bacterium]|nr:Rne/Rng family ribonuclease [Bacillota bacterium]
MSKEIVVNVDHEETRVATVEHGSLVEIAIERPTGQRVAGNIYKGRVENVLPGMQAAFVNIGLERNAFLYVDDALPIKEDEDDLPDLRHASIGDVVKEGQEIVAQVAKEPIGTKGARVTRHLTLPGRYLVLMPGVDYVGVSRRIEDEAKRERLRKLAESIKPEGSGLIVRTVAEGAEEEELSRDVEFLARLWERIQAKAKVAGAPAVLHKDLGLLLRVVRDAFSEDVDKLTIDSRQEYEKVLELLDLTAPELKPRVHYHSPQERSLFDAYGVEPEIEKALKRRVWLKSGGYIVIDRTEALTSIDVNTGKFVGTTNLADTVFKTNLEAAREIAHQIRLRDIGGIIVVDFIDMEVPEHRQQVLKALEEAVRADRTKTNVLGLTQLGLVEMTRKKVRQSLDDVLQRACPYCDGRGKVLSEETMSRKVRADIKRILKHTSSEAVLIEVHPSVAALLIGSGGANLRDLERETGKLVYVKGDSDCHLETMNLRALGTREEVEAKALPVRAGQQLELKVEEPHATNPVDGIARVDGYVVDIEGGGGRVGERVRIEVVKAFRTYAKAHLI